MIYSLSCVLAVISASSASPVPSIQMRYYPGSSGYAPWQLTVSASGDAKQQIYTFPTVAGRTVEHVAVKTRRLSDAERARLLSVLDEQAFFELPSQLSIFRFEHSGQIVLRVGEARCSHEVTYHWPHGGSDRPAATRFASICKAILQIVPSPNDNVELRRLLDRGFPAALRPTNRVATNASNQAMRLTASYERLGPLESPPLEAQHLLMQVRTFIATHWQQRHRGYASYTLRIPHEEPLTGSAYIEPARDGKWHIRFESHYLRSGRLLHRFKAVSFRHHGRYLYLHDRSGRLVGTL